MTTQTNDLKEAIKRWILNVDKTIVVAIFKELIEELSDLRLFKVEHIAVEFVDGDLKDCKNRQPIDCNSFHNLLLSN